MPNASDPFLSGLALPLSHDPLERIGYTSSKPDLSPAALEAAQEAAITAFLEVLDQSTGLDLIDYWNKSLAVKHANQAFAQALQAALTNYTTGPAFVAACEAAWNTWIVAVTDLPSGQHPTFNDLLQSLFGIDPSTGKTTSDFVNGLQDTLTQLGAAVSGDTANSGPWAWLANIVAAWNQLIGKTHTVAVNNSNTLAIRNNKPLTYGLDDTTESNIPFPQATSLIPVSTAPMMTFVRCQQDDVKNTIAFVASLPSSGAATQVYVNLWKIDFAANRCNLVLTSTNLATLLSTTPAWVFISANATAVDPGDVLMIEWNRGTGSGSFNLLGQSVTTAAPAHPLANLPGLAMTVAASTTPPSAPGVTAFPLPAASSFNNKTIPYVGLETSNPPPPVYPDHTETYTQTRTYQINSWASHVDLIGVGQGGGGQGETGGTVGRGGSPGVWGGRTLVVGTDIAVGGSITVSLATDPSARGSSDPGSGGAYFGNGKDGGATVFTWNNAAGVPQSMTCAGGQGGGLGNNNNLTTYGQGPGNFTFPATGQPGSETYTGGANVVVPTDGYTPGSSGPGGQAFQYGFNGGRGQAWTVERQ